MEQDNVLPYIANKYGIFNRLTIYEKKKSSAQIFDGSSLLYNKCVQVIAFVFSLNGFV